MNKDKRGYRQLKREIKRAGTKRVRQQLKRNLLDHPEEAAFAEFDYGSTSSETMNGNDRDATRHRAQPPDDPDLSD